MEAELKALRARVEALHEQAGRLAERAGRGRAISRPTICAVVDAELCVGCGLCERVCPFGAIHVDRVASVDAQRCRGCGACVEGCPRHAVRLIEAATRSASPEEHEDA